MNRINISSGSPWEEKFAYSRAVRVGDHVYVSGTTAFNDQGIIVGKNDVYRQTKQIYNNIKQALEKAGSSLEHIYRVRFYILDITKHEELLKAHVEIFSEIKPTATLLEVNRLLSEEMLVEIEVDAYCTNKD